MWIGDPGDRSDEERAGRVLSGRLGRNATIYVGSAILNAAIPFILLPILSRALGATDYGVVGTFTALVQCAAVLVGASTHGFLTVYYFEVTEDRFARAVTGCVLIAVATAPVLWLLLWLNSGSILAISGVGPGMIWTVVCAALGQFLMQVALAVYRVEGRAIRFGVTQVTATALNLCLTLLLVLGFDMGWEGRALGHAVALILVASAGLILLRQVGMLMRPDWSAIRSSLRFGVPLIPHGIAGVLLASTDRFVLTGALDSSAAGRYYAAFQICWLLVLVSAAANQAWAPWLMHQLGSDSEANLRTIVRLTYGAVAACALAVVSLILLGPWLLVFLAGAEYGDGGGLILWLAPAAGARGCYYLFTNYIFYSKRTEFLSLVTSVSAAIQIVGMIVVVPAFGAEGAAAVVLLTSLAHCAAVAIIAQRLVPMPWAGVR